LLPLAIDQAIVAAFKALEHVQVALLAFIFCLLVSVFLYVISTVPCKTLAVTALSI
jgi:hypothetical protein